MPLKHAILGILNYHDMTGYDIDRWLQKPIAIFWHAQTSQVNKELNDIAKNKCLISLFINSFMLSPQFITFHL